MAAAETPRTRYGVTFAVLATAALAFSLLQSLIIPAIPQLEQTLHVSESAASWLLTAYLLSAAIATPVLGRVGDTIGKEKVIVGVLVALSVGTLISALGDSLEVILIGRVIQGVAGAIFPLAFGIIRDEFPAARVAGAIGFMSAILGVGSGAGIVLAGPILEHLNYHWLFWIPLCMSLGATVATFFFVPESPVRAPSGINWLGAALDVGLAGHGADRRLVRADVGLGQPGMRAPVPGDGRAGRVVGVVRAALPLAARRHADDADPGRVGDQPGRPAVRVRDVRHVHHGAAIRPDAHFCWIRLRRLRDPVGPLPGALRPGHGGGGPVHGWLSLRIGSKSVLIIGSLISAASYGVLVIDHSQSWTIYLASGLLGVGLAPAFASMANLIIEAVPADQTGVATGMNTNFRSVGAALGAGIATSLVISEIMPNGYPKESGYVAAFVVSGIGLLVAALAACLIPSRTGASSVVRGESHPALTAEAEAIVGAIAYVPEEPA